MKKINNITVGDIFTELAKRKTFQKIMFSKPCNNDIIKCVVHPFEKNGDIFIQFETFLKDGKALHKNVAIEESARLLTESANELYRQTNVFDSTVDYEIKVSKKGETVIFKESKKQNNDTSCDNHSHIIKSHNKEKNYILSADKSYDFLIKLGISDKNGRIYDKKMSKFKQINRFLEYVKEASKVLSKDERAVIYDLCCGKSYLTFAVYYYFKFILNKNVTMVGIDRKTDVIEYCNKTAKELGYTGLSFVAGDINDFAPDETPSLVISLHACDIATDIVLANAVKWNSKIILSTPCCHHEMFNQISCESLSFIEQYSLLKQKLCDSATDALRAKRLECEGYDVNVVELIDMSETPKNIMISATKKSSSVSESERQQLLKEYKDACSFLNVSPYLDKLLK